MQNIVMSQYSEKSVEGSRVVCWESTMNILSEMVEALDALPVPSTLCILYSAEYVVMSFSCVDFYYSTL